MKLTDDEATKIVEWFQNELGLQDWAISVSLSNTPPKGIGSQPKEIVGLCFPDATMKEATIWVSPKRCQAVDDTEWEVLLHECWHIVAADVGICNDEDDRREFIWNRLAHIFLDIYRKGLSYNTKEEEGDDKKRMKSDKKKDEKSKV